MHRTKFIPPTLALLLTSALLITEAQAHCPLCTAGVAAAAGVAALLGVKTIVVGLFVGALAVSAGFWVANAKGLGNLPKFVLVAASYALTVLPLLAALPGVVPVYVSIVGDYGSPLNRVYLLNSLLSGSLIGAAIVALSPRLSGKLTELRGGRRVAFQGVIVTVSLLLIAALILQVRVWEVRA